MAHPNNAANPVSNPQEESAKTLSQPSSSAQDSQEIAVELLRQRRRQFVGRLLVRAANAAQQESIAALQRLGYDDVRMADNALFIHLEARGTRIVELARRARMSKQGMGQLVRSAERRGYVRREPDPNDGRAQRILWTDKGLAMLEQGLPELEKLSTQLQTALGEAQFAQFEDLLAQVADALDPEGF